MNSQDFVYNNNDEMSTETSQDIINIINKIRAGMGYLRSYVNGEADGNGKNFNDIIVSYKYVTTKVEEWNLDVSKFGESINDHVKNCILALENLENLLESILNSIENFCKQTEANLDRRI